MTSESFGDAEPNDPTAGRETSSTFAPSIRPASPQPPRAVVNIQVSDVDPLMAFIDRLTNLHRRLERGEIATVDEARDELGLILALQEGETLG